MSTTRRTTLIRASAIAALLGAVFAIVRAETINPNNDNSKFAYAENVGWINAEPSGNGGPGVQVSGTKLTGYMYGENIGWINMSCTNNSTCASTGNYGVKNDGAGHLSGYAWGENIGWISFSCQNTPATCATAGNYGVSIDPVTGIFSGRAYGENIGWITFSATSPVAYKVQTDDGDGVAGASDNCPFDSNAAQTNTDAAAAFPWIQDGVGPDGATLGGDACDVDDDNDRCLDVNELSANALIGGDRDTLNPWDFFDVPVPVLRPADTSGTRSRTVTLSDVIAVLFYVGTSAANPNQANGNAVIYGSDLNANGVTDGQEYDRTIPNSAKPYRSGPPNGAVTIGDAIVGLQQVGANCTVSPP
jgi:hypothetical protein